MKAGPATYNLQVSRGDDVSWQVQFFESDGTTADDVSSATIVADVLDPEDQSQEAAIGQSVSTNTLTLTLSDTQTGTGTLPNDRYRWALEITESNDTDSLIVGWIQFLARGVAGAAPTAPSSTTFTIGQRVLVVTPL